jgi:hypothetical protein
LGLCSEIRPFGRVDEDHFEKYVMTVHWTFHKLLTRGGQERQISAGDFYRGALGRDEAKRIQLTFRPNPSYRYARDQVTAENVNKVKLVAEGVQGGVETVDLQKANIYVCNVKRASRYSLLC